MAVNAIRMVGIYGFDAALYMAEDCLKQGAPPAYVEAALKALREGK